MIRKITKDIRGNIWVATRSGLSKLSLDYQEKLKNGIDTVFENLTTDQGLPQNSIHALLFDKKGNLWCSTRSKGITIVVPRGGKNSSIIPKDSTTYEMIYYTEEDGLPGRIIRDMIEDKEGNIWIATENMGISVLTLELENKKVQTLENYTIQNGLPVNFVHTLFEDREGNIWLGTNGEGVSRYSGKMFRTFTAKDGLIYEGVMQICEDKKGYYWLRGFTEGLSVYNPKKKTWRSVYKSF